MPAPRPRPISDILPKIQNVAQTSQYIVKFALPVSPLRSYLRRKGVNDRFVAEDIGLLCSSAVLPGSALASVDTRGDFQGVIEKFAHTRNFTQINLEFYVDNDYKILKFFEHYIEFITGRIYKNVIASFESEKNNYSVRAVNPDHQFIEKSEIKEGRFINQIDIENYTKNIVIGNLVVEDLFGDTNPIGQYIDLNKIKFKVVGVFVERTEGSDSNEARVIYMPISTAQKIYGNNDYIDQINLTYNPSLSEQEAILLGEKIIDEIKDVNFVAADDQSAVRIRNRARENQEVSQFNSVLAILVLIIGMGTLVAGVVGISNIMIFIVKERTKEIGIRKALGAPPISIIMIIIFESIFVTAIAGYIGLLIGGAILNGIDLEEYWITDPGVSSSLVFSASITLVIAGTIAGYIPAKRAASIKPIEALRDE